MSPLGKLRRMWAASHSDTRRNQAKRLKSNANHPPASSPLVLANGLPREQTSLFTATIPASLRCGHPAPFPAVTAAPLVHPPIRATTRTVAAREFVRAHVL